MEKVNKGDFIQLEFSGYANNELFDTTIQEKAKELGMKSNVNPVIASAGNEMLLKGLDENLIGKEIGKEYSVILSPEKAFGQRQPSLIKTVPLRLFREKNINPIPGMAFQIDGNIVKILSNNGGRIIVDFNNPLAGKVVEYKFKILRKVDNNEEKVNAIQDFFFRRRFKFQIEDKKVIFEPTIKPLLEMFNKKFNELTGLDFQAQEKPKEIKQPNKDKPKGNKSNKKEVKN